MCQAFAFSLRQSLGGRLERAGDCFIVDRLAARSRGGRSKRQIADGDALKMPELAILAWVLVAARIGLSSTYIWQQPGPLAGQRRLGLAGSLGLLMTGHVTSRVWQRAVEMGARSVGCPSSKHARES